MAAAGIRAIAVLDMENYVQCNRHMHAAAAQLLEQPDIRKLLDRRTKGAFPDADTFEDALSEVVSHSAAVREFADAVLADMRSPADRLARPAIPDLRPGDDVRLMVVTDHNHKSDRVMASRTARLVARLQAAVGQGWITQEEYDAWAANVDPQDWSDVSNGNVTSAEIHVVGDVDGGNTLGSAAGSGAEEPPNAREEAKQVIRRVLCRLCRKAFRDAEYVTRVDGATADEVIAVLARRLRPGLLCVLSADLDFYQLERHGITHVRPDRGEAYPRYENQRGDVFLLKCAMRGKGRDISMYGPAFGPIPRGLRYLDAIGCEVTGSFECTEEYRGRFEAFNQLTGDHESGRPWNSGSVTGVLEWLHENREHAPEDARVRFLRNVFRQNIDPDHDVFSITPDDVRERISRAVEATIHKRGWAALVRQ